MKSIFRLGTCVLTVFAAGCVVGRPSAPYSAYPTRTVLVFDQPGTLRYLPGYNVYYVPDTPRDIYMVDDVWYHRADRLWYQSRSIEGPWDQIDVVNVPAPVLKLPPGYRDTRTPHEDIPWDDFKKGRRRSPQPPPPDLRPPGEDGRERPEGRWERGEGRRPGEEQRDRQDGDRTERQVPPVLVVPPGGGRPPGVGTDRTEGRPEQTLPPLRIGRPAYLNRLVRSGILYVPEIGQEVFLFEKKWYRRQDGFWYLASDYDGRWNLESEAALPRALRDLSPRYREEPMERVRYPLGASAQPPAPPAPTPTDRPGTWKERQPPAVSGDGRGLRGGAPEAAVPPKAPAREEKPLQHEQTAPPRATQPPATEPQADESIDEGKPGSADRTAPSRVEPPGRSESRPGRLAGSEKGKADRLPKMDIPKPDTLRRISTRGIEYLPGGPEILRCQGRWYLRSEGSWYGSGDYAGPWSLLSERELPQAIRVLPAGYRSEPAEDVPFGDERGGKGR